MWISLVGFNTSGKTTLARELGQLAGRRAVDLDHAVERLAGCPLPGIFDRGGPPLFRECEARVLDQLPAGEQLILAAGGGTLERSDTVVLLQERGLVVWLDAPWLFLRRRLAPIPPAEPSPLWKHLGEDGLFRLYCRRRPLFAACSRLRLDARLDPGNLARRLLGRSLQLMPESGGHLT